MGMKPHQACYHLNGLILAIREERDRLKKEKPVTEWRDNAGGKRAATKEESASHAKWTDEQVKRCEDQLEALDIAATSLTKRTV